MLYVGRNVAAVVTVAITDTEVVRIAKAAEVRNSEVAVCGVRTTAYPG